MTVRISLNLPDDAWPGICDALAARRRRPDKIGTATGQKLGFWNATPVVQQVLATGAGASVDDVITALQTIGLFKQA